VASFARDLVIGHHMIWVILPPGIPARR